jgi:hypothetical protein
MKSIALSLLLAICLFACTNHGTKLEKDYLEVYYKKGISKELAQKTLDFFYPLWKEESGKTPRKSIQLAKADGDTISFRVVQDKKKLEEIGDAAIYEMANELSATLFDGAPVNIVLTDNKFKPQRTLVFKKNSITEDPGYGEKVRSGNVEVYATDEFSGDEARQLANYLNNEMNPETVISFQLTVDDQQNPVIRMVSTPEKASQLDDAVFQEMTQLLSAEMFKDGPVIFQLTDETFKPFKTFYHNPE